MSILYGKTKTDQAGENSREARSVYANPFNPSICPIVALALYLMDNSDLRTSADNDHGLFPGGHQASRFSKHMKEILSSDSGTQLLNQLGLNLDDIGTHSIRKGVGTYACSGSTSGPGIVSVCIRMGWSMGGVADRYLQFEAAADKYLGRVCAGLNQSSSEFCTIMPHFGAAEVSNILERSFPTLYKQTSLLPVLKHCLASVVYHIEFIRETLPDDHNLFQNYLFRTPGLIKYLREFVTIAGNQDILVSGIPPHVDIIQKLEKIGNIIEDCPSRIVSQMTDVMEANGIAAGNISRSVLEQTLEKYLSKLNQAVEEKSYSDTDIVNEEQTKWYM
jgi:hypothetical protein